MSTKRSIKISTSKALFGSASRDVFQHAIDFLFYFVILNNSLYFLDKREEVYMSSIKMPKFKERKAAQVTRLFIQCNSGQSFSTRKLLKLIYLVDRKALELWGFPVTYDTPKNLPYEGLMPGYTYDLINPLKKKRNALSMFMPDSYWYHYFCRSNEGHYTIPTELNPGTADLSRAEIELIGNIFDQFGYKTDEQLDDYCRTLPESRHSETPYGEIDWKVLLQAVGWEGEDLAEIKKDLEFQTKFEGLITAGENGIVTPYRS